MGRIFLRVYTFPNVNKKSHSFYVGHTNSGLSTRLFDGVLIHNATTTFTDLRRMIEYKFEDGMYRRTMIYQELMHIMDSSSSSCTNPHGYKDSDKREYVFGTIPGVGEENNQANSTTNGTTIDISFTIKYDVVPTIIQQDVEDEPIVEIIGDPLKYDIIIVPITQVRPYDNIVTPETIEQIDQQKMEKES